MDFLESAAVLVPALMGLAVTVYDGEGDTLTKFESQYCFSPRFQAVYTARGLEGFFSKGSAAFIYDAAEPLGSRLAAFRAGDRWVLLGPYVEEGWNGGAARALLARLGASETAVLPFKAYRCKLPITQRDSVLQAARLIACHMDSGGAEREVRTSLVQAGEGDALAYPSDYEDSAVVNRRYAVEERIQTAISRGDRAAAMKALREMKEVTADLRFISDDLRNQLAGAAILRTVVRMGARQAGLSPVLIDSISQEYAQRMQHAVSKGELNGLIAGVVKRFCAEVQALRKSSYSPYVRRAMDYMGANLSRQMTVAEIAKAAGADRHRLTRTFEQETGMTLKQYLAKRRCEIAAELLRGSGASVQDVAAYVGYPDNNYFSKVFKAVYGVPPQDYRNKQGLAR